MNPTLGMRRGIPSYDVRIRQLPHRTAGALLCCTVLYCTVHTPWNTERPAVEVWRLGGLEIWGRWHPCPGASASPQMRRAGSCMAHLGKSKRRSDGYRPLLSSWFIALIPPGSWDDALLSHLRRPANYRLFRPPGNASAKLPTLRNATSPTPAWKQHRVTLEESSWSLPRNITEHAPSGADVSDATYLVGND